MNRMRNYFGGPNANPNGNVNFGGPFGNVMNVLTKFKQFMQNPMAAIMGSGLDVPPNIQNNPEAITNYLRSSGKMSEDQFNQASQMASWVQNFLGNKQQR